MKRTYLNAAVLAIGSAFLFSACGGADEKAALPDAFTAVDRVEGQTMGTFYAITVPGGYPGGEQALKDDAQAVFKEVTNAISTFDDNAELARFNNHASVMPFEISPFLAEVLAEVMHNSLLIGFASDITVGPLVNLWGFGPDNMPERAPSQAEIDDVKTFVGPDKFELRPGKNPRLVKIDPRVKLDLSTVGEGLGADLVARKFDRQNIENYLISVAGAIRTKGLNPKGEDWKIGIENPVDPSRPPIAVVCPFGMAMSTAGTYRNFFVDEKTKKRYSHIIDPATGRPVEHSTVSVTVISQSALTTDTLDTGLLVMGADEALKWAEANETAVYTIEIDDKGEPAGRYSRYMEPYLKCEIPSNLRSSRE